MSGKNAHIRYMARTEMAYTSQVASQHVIMLSVFSNLKHLGGGPTNSGVACNDFLLFANMKIQLTGTFEVTAKIKSQSQAMCRERHEVRGPHVVLAVGQMVG
jgi:hypothetical protein